MTASSGCVMTEPDAVQGVAHLRAGRPCLFEGGMSSLLDGFSRPVNPCLLFDKFRETVARHRTPSVNSTQCTVRTRGRCVQLWGWNPASLKMACASGDARYW